MKKNFVWFLMVLLLLTGCDYAFLNEWGAHTFCQDRENVAKVEICQYDQSTAMHTLLVELSADEIDSLWQELPLLDCYNNHKYGEIYGDLVILITYQNGGSEKIGLLGIEWTEPNGLSLKKEYAIEEKDLCELLCKYVDPEILAEKSEYFRHFWNNRTEE